MIKVSEDTVKFIFIQQTLMQSKKNLIEDDDCFSHVIQASTVFLTALRAYGIYDKEYHVIASD